MVGETAAAAAVEVEVEEAAGEDADAEEDVEPLAVEGSHFVETPVERNQRKTPNKQLAR